MSIIKSMINKKSLFKNYSTKIPLIKKSRLSFQLGLFLLKFFCAICFIVFPNFNSIANALRDPTTPLNNLPKRDDPLALELAAISGANGRYFAIINNQRVYEGSIINGVKIESISDKAVVYSYKGERHKLNMRLSLMR